MTNGGANTTKITVTVKTPILQSMTADFTTDNTVWDVIDKARAEFKIRLEDGDIVQIRPIGSDKPLNKESKLGDASVKDGATLILVVGPPMSPNTWRSICIYLLLCALVAGFFLLAIWPQSIVNTPGNVTAYNYTRPVFGLIANKNPNPELDLLLVVIFSGVIGAFIQSMASLMQHKSDLDLMARWAGWYYSRPPLAIGFALMVYLLIRGGLLSLSGVSLGADPTRINVFAVAAISAIVGMFTDEASKRLGKVVDTLFGVEDGTRTSTTRSRENPLTINLDVSPQSGAVSFAPACSFKYTGGQKPVKVIIDYGDGTSSVDVTNWTGADSSHSYTKPGPYKIRITAIDNSDSSASDSKTINVSAK